MQSSNVSTKDTKVSADLTDIDETGGAQLVNKEAVAKKLEESKQLREAMEARSSNALGNPNAVIQDPFMVRVEPRYNVVQNQSHNFLIIPDLKTGPEDMGLSLQPGEAIKLTDFYSPQEINRSKGLRYSTTKIVGLNGNCALVPIASEEAAADFKLPERVKRAKGDVFEDTVPNDFDLRFEELEAKDAKAEERMRRKTLAGRVTRQHGAAPAHV